MDNNNNNHNLITFLPNQIIRINNEISINRRDYHKMIISTIIYTCLIPFIFFLMTKNIQKAFPLITENTYYEINDNNDINDNNINEIDSQIRQLNGENILMGLEKQFSNKTNSTALEEELRKYLDIIMEKLSKNLDSFNNGNSSDKTSRFSIEEIFAQKEFEYFLTRLTERGFSGSWKGYPYNPYASKNESFEYFYYENFSEINKGYYFNSSLNKLKIGKEENGTAFVNFKKLYDKNSGKLLFAINLKMLEGNYLDNWIDISSIVHYPKIIKIPDEKRSKFYFRGEFISTLSPGKILDNKNFLHNKKTCMSLIEVEFPLSQLALYILEGNKQSDSTIINTINNKNFSMVLSSQCGFRIRIEAEKSDKILNLEIQKKKKEISTYFWMNIIVSLLNYFSYSVTSCALNRHQDTISTFSILCLSQNIAWHSYRSLSDINLGLNFPYFFGVFLLMALFPLINFIGFDLSLLVLYWKINKRILSNRKFIILRLKFFFIFYSLMFCCFFLIGELYYNKTLIWISAVFLWTPQIIHNINRYNKYSYPLIYILSTTVDRMIIPFYFRSRNSNLLSIKTDTKFLSYVAGYILITIIILYLQIFLGPRFMLCKRFKRVELNFYRSKAQLLREKPNIINEECNICLCPLINSEQNNNKVNNNNEVVNDINDNITNRDIKQQDIINKTYNNNSVDLMNSNQTNQQNDDILDVANKKTKKLLKIMKLYKNKTNPIIISNLHLQKKSKYKRKKINVRSFYDNILSILKFIFYHNLLFFYNYNPNKKNKKYMLLRCGHVFHSDCIEKWFEIKKECPSCRESMATYI